MTLDEFKNLDPQRAVTVRFGMMDVEDGSVQWQENWSDVRLFISHDYHTGEWLITPMSLDGRPMGFNLDGHEEPETTKGIFASSVTPHVMQVRFFLEPQLLVDAAASCREGEFDSMQEALEAEFFFLEDLSKAGQLYVIAVEAALYGGTVDNVLQALSDAMVG